MMEYYNTPMMEAINECVHNERDRLILRLRLIDGYTYTEIEGKVNCTVRNINYIMDKYTPALYAYILKNKKRSWIEQAAFLFKKLLEKLNFI